MLASTQSCDGQLTKTFGDPPSGQIQYTEDGRMSAFLMNPNWAQRDKQAAQDTDVFFAYAGRWQLNGDQVHHHIEFSSAPTKIGTVFVRTVNLLAAQQMELATKPETSNSGKVYISRLLWQRHPVNTE